MVDLHAAYLLEDEHDNISSGDNVTVMLLLILMYPLFLAVQVQSCASVAAAQPEFLVQAWTGVRWREHASCRAANQRAHYAPAQCVPVNVGRNAHE
jgi:hypothetical protein